MPLINFRAQDNPANLSGTPELFYYSSVCTQDEEDDDELGVDTAGNVMTGGQDDDEDMEDADLLHAQDIDAHWLQRRITDSYKDAGSPLDPDQSQRLSNDVFDILQVPIPVFVSFKLCNYWLVFSHILHVSIWIFICQLLSHYWSVLPHQSSFLLRWMYLNL